MHMVKTMESMVKLTKTTLTYPHLTQSNYIFSSQMSFFSLRIAHTIHHFYLRFCAETGKTNK